MSIEKITHKIIIEVDNRNGRHKVKRHGMLIDSESQLQDTPFTESVKRVDIEAVLGTELAINAEKVTELSTQLDSVAVLEAELAAVKAQLAAAQKVDKTQKLPRASFLFMSEKLGITQDTVYSLIANLPRASDDEKRFARMVYDTQQWFERDNQLLNALVELSPLTHEQVDEAWEQALQYSW